jgi:hypothetical protein
MDHLAGVDRAAVFAKPGMGKTTMTLTFLDHLHNIWGEDRPTLVLAPLRVARDTWANDAGKWDHLRGVEVVPIIGSSDERKAALRKTAPIYTTNYENLVWLVETLGKRWPFATVVADESTKLKGFRLRQGGKRAQALGSVAHAHVERWINLTGTPASNGLEDLWGQTWFLDGGQRLGRTFSAFRDRWFRPAKQGQFHQWRAVDWAQEDIQQRIADICLTLDPKDWFDLRDPIVNRIEVELPTSARAQYRELERELFTMIGTQAVEAMTAAAKSMKCLQMANGAVYVDDSGAWAEVHTEKLDALDELADQTGDDPLLVMYQFKSDLARLKRRFPDALDLSISGDMARAMDGVGKIWLGHPASMGHGVDGLQYHCNTIVFFAQDWNLEYHDQALERVGPMRQLQAGKDRPVFVHYIVARQTVDELVMMRREGKRSVQDLLLDYLKGKK